MCLITKAGRPSTIKPRRVALLHLLALIVLFADGLFDSGPSSGSKQTFTNSSWSTVKKPRHVSFLYVLVLVLLFADHLFDGVPSCGSKQTSATSGWSTVKDASFFTSISTTMTSNKNLTTFGSCARASRLFR